MGHKGNKRATKRLATPKHVQIPRKHGKWFITPRPGPHPKRFCLPLGHVLRDLLGLARTAEEAKKIVKRGMVLVDGRVVRDHRFPLGLMDVLEIPLVEKYYRVFPDPHHGLVLFEIPKKEAQFKLCRIEDKHTVKGGHVQLNLHDGRNILVQVEDPRKPVEDVYKTRDTLRISLPDQKILEHLEFRVQNLVIITGGKNIGQVGKMKNVVKHYGPAASVVTIEDESGRVVETSLEYAFVIGKRSPRLTLPGST
ncbi:MAG: 30S ribosomal protein S4e [Promethearchaeota archaeon]